jgi:hypothetical protein
MWKTKKILGRCEKRSPFFLHRSGGRRNSNRTERLEDNIPIFLLPLRLNSSEGRANKGSIISNKEWWYALPHLSSSDHK